MVSPKVKLAVIGVIVAAVLLASLSPMLLSFMVTSRQSLSESESVRVEHVDWIVQELVTEDIRANYLTNKRLEVEFLITPDNTYFTVTVDVRTPVTKEGRARDPDVRFTVGRDAVGRLLSAGDFFAEVKNLRDEGRVEMDMLKPYEELVEKGYKDIYDQIVK